MVLKRIIIIIHLFYLIFWKPTLSFSINSVDKIALERETVVVNDRHLYLPLGWPTSVFCEAAAKLEDINVIEPKNLFWIIRYPDDGREWKITPDEKDNFDVQKSSLIMKKVSRDLDRVVLECHIDRPENTSLVSRNRIEIQDCKSRNPGDTMAYNLHDPCAFGQCHVTKISTKRNQTVSEVVGCTCFRQYTGKHCHISKPESWILDFVPYSMVVGILMIYIVGSCIVSVCKEERKQEKLMAISQLVGFSDRNNLKLSKLYPFIKKLRRCNFPDPDEEESRDKKYKKLQKKYQKLKERAAANNTAATPGIIPGSMTGNRTVTMPVTVTGLSTGTTTGTTTGASTMNTVSGTLDNSTGAASGTIGAEEGFRPVPSRRTNRKRNEHRRPKKRLPTVTENSSDGTTSGAESGNSNVKRF